MQPKIRSIHITQDTFTFIKELEQVRDYNIFLVSFDISSLFTNIPLNETIELALDYILSNNPDVNIIRKDIKKLFQFGTSETNFYSNGESYEQVDGVAMGYPLTPVPTNLFMGHHEQHWLIQKEHHWLIHFCFIRDMLIIFSASSKHQSRKISFLISWTPDIKILNLQLKKNKIKSYHF